MKSFLSFLSEQRKLPEFELSKPSGGGEQSHLITVPGLGHINYDHDPAEKTNRIWWVERKGGKRGEGAKLVSLMQKQHPATHIGWGVTSQSGKKLASRWHRNERKRAKRAGTEPVTRDFEPHEGQFDPFS